jgi:manganese-dependent ADP-ribose/CDP-alcohol diphosphatase
MTTLQQRSRSIGHTQIRRRRRRRRSTHQSNNNPTMSASTLLFTFGLFADVQYADVPDDATKRYRATPALLRRAVDAFNVAAPRFVVNLGDIVDGRNPEAEWTCIAAELQRLQIPLKSVVGNHCLRIAPRALLHRRLGIEHESCGYYRFDVDSTRVFLALDSLDRSLFAELDESRADAAQMLAALKASGAANAVDWNGGFSDAQLAWLESELLAAKLAGRRAILFAHIPVCREATSERHLLWNNDAALAVLDRHAGVVEAFFAGHYHTGGYACRCGVHHLTLNGMLEAPVSATTCHAFVDVFSDRLELRGSEGSAIISRTLTSPGTSVVDEIGASDQQNLSTTNAVD